MVIEQLENGLYVATVKEYGVQATGISSLDALSWAFTEVELLTK